MIPVFRCFSCIVGLAYSNIAFGGITPFFSALISAPGSTIRNVFALQMCIDDSATDAEQYDDALSPTLAVL